MCARPAFPWGKVAPEGPDEGNALPAGPSRPAVQPAAFSVGAALAAARTVRRKETGAGWGGRGQALPYKATAPFSVPWRWFKTRRVRGSGGESGPVWDRPLQDASAFA